MKIIISAALVAASFAVVTPAVAAEPIVGKWKRNDGTIIQYTGSGSRYCAKVVNGKYAGKSIGCMSGTGNDYKGKVTVLSEGKTYTGKARVNGKSMKLSGCVLGVLCKGETLSRQ